MLETLPMKPMLRPIVFSLTLAAGVIAAMPVASAAVPTGQTATPATSAKPAGSSKAAAAGQVPMVRQSPYARAVHENAAAENAALAQMQANGQPVPLHAARPAAQLSPGSKGGRANGSHR